MTSQKLARTVHAAVGACSDRLMIQMPAKVVGQRLNAGVALGGIFLQISGFIVLAIALYAVAVLFQLVTLPVEFDASKRAKRQLHDLGLVASNEGSGVEATLNAAAWTYVAGALAAIAQLLYFLTLLGNR